MRIVIDIIKDFLQRPSDQVGQIYNERSLQMEIGYYFRCRGFSVEFEKPFKVERPQGSTKTPKTYLDLFVTGERRKLAIELKTPLNKRHPETLFDFCADLEFVESLVRSGEVDQGLCLLMTNDHVFWEDSGRGSGIHNFFRRSGEILTGKIIKPTGKKDTAVVLTGQYSLSDEWHSLDNPRLLSGARYLMVESNP